MVTATTHTAIISTSQPNPEPWRTWVVKDPRLPTPLPNGMDVNVFSCVFEHLPNLVDLNAVWDSLKPLFEKAACSKPSNYLIFSDSTNPKVKICLLNYTSQNISWSKDERELHINGIPTGECYESLGSNKSARERGSCQDFEFCYVFAIELNRKLYIFDKFPGVLENPVIYEFDLDNLNDECRVHDLSEFLDTLK